MGEEHPDSFAGCSPSLPIMPMLTRLCRSRWIREAVLGVEGTPDNPPEIQLPPQRPLLSTAFPQLRAAAQLPGLCDSVYICVWQDLLLRACK